MLCSHCGGTGQEPGTNGHDGDLAVAKRVLGFLNEKTGRHYQETPVNLRFIRSRLRQGATEAQCRAVIALRVAKWGGGDMAEWLRPATLFNETKFSQYLGELPATAFVQRDPT